MCGAIYNELLHGSPLAVASLKTLAALSIASVATFLFMALVRLCDRIVTDRQLFANR